MIALNNHRSTCHRDLRMFDPHSPIVRERWLLRVSNAAPLPDTKPDAVYASEQPERSGFVLLRRAGRYCQLAATVWKWTGRLTPAA